MNKKKYKMGIKNFSKTLLVLLLIFSGVNVFAESPGDAAREKEAEQLYSDTCATDYHTPADIENCKKAAKLCYSTLTPTKFNFRVENNGTGEFVLKLDNKTNEKVKFKITYTISRNTSNDTPVENVIEINAGQTYTNTLATGWNESTNIKIDAKAQLVSDFTASVKMEGTNDNVNCNSKYFATASAEIPASKVDEFDNPDYYLTPGGICYKYMNGGLTAADVKSYTKLLNEYSYANIKGITTARGTGDVVFQSIYPYCFNSKITKKDNNAVKNIYKAVKSIYDSKQKVESSNRMDPLIPGSIEVKDLNKAIDLTCDAFGMKDETIGIYTSEGNTRSFYHYLEPIKKTVKYYYNYEKPTEVEICNVQCREDLTITYGPPVAVKAGFCFEYEVKVESKVTCDSQINKNGAPDYDKYQVCEPIPICENNYWQSRHQAGPNEEFDACVKETDGGKYTQKAINKCYKKVYGNSKKKTNSKMNLALNYQNVQKMANSIPQCNPKNIVDYNSWWNVYNAYTAQGYEGGYYTKKGGFHWQAYKQGVKYYLDKEQTEEIPVMDGCYWNGYARFYFNNQATAQRTIYNDGNSAFRYDPLGWDLLGTWYYYPGTGRTFVPAGIKDAKKYNTTWCSDRCHYEYSCNGKYYNQVAPVSNSTCTKNNNSGCDAVGSNSSTHMSAYAQYQEDYSNYLTAVQSCDAAATCDTKTATYRMTINNLEKTTKVCEVGEDGDDCTTWTDTGKSKEQCEYNTKNPTKNGVTTPALYDDVTGLFTGDTIKAKCSDLGAADITTYNETTIREISGVCAKLPGDNQHYRTIIAFPGSWLYVKNYTYVHKNPKDKTNYLFVPGKYCVGTTIKPVNENWWKWDQYNHRSITESSKLDYYTTKDAGGKNITLLKDGKYNIKAFVETFGKSHWKFNVKCFYAAIGSDNKGKDCTKENCEPDDELPNPLKYDIKAAALDELFPSTETITGKGVSNKTNMPEAKVEKLNITEDTKKNNILKIENTTGRTTGFNWTCESANIQLKGYPITPVALIAKIQSQGDKVYNDKSELDYKFTLTPDQLKAIRKSNESTARKNDPYTIIGNSTWENKNKNGVRFYKSSLLNNEKFVTVNVKPRNHNCNNMKNGQCDEYKEFINSSSCEREKN